MGWMSVTLENEAGRSSLYSYGSLRGRRVRRSDYISVRLISLATTQTLLIVHYLP